jgi:hypothetical protein
MDNTDIPTTSTHRRVGRFTGRLAVALAVVLVADLAPVDTSTISSGVPDAVANILPGTPQRAEAATCTMVGPVLDCKKSTTGTTPGTKTPGTTTTSPTTKYQCYSSKLWGLPTNRDGMRTIADKNNCNYLPPGVEWRACPYPYVGAYQHWPGTQWGIGTVICKQVSAGTSTPAETVCPIKEWMYIIHPDGRKEWKYNNGWVKNRCYPQNHYSSVSTPCDSTVTGAYYFEYGYASTGKVVSTPSPVQRTITVTTVCAAASSTEWGRELHQTITVVPPASVQVGGLLRPALAKLNAQWPTFPCVNTCTNSSLPNPTLIESKYRLTVEGTDGYQQCATATSTACSFRVTDRSDTALTVLAYNATTLTQRLKFFATDLSLKWVQHGVQTVVQQRCYAVSGSAGPSQNCVSGTTTTPTSRQRSTAHNVINNPTELLVIGATATPTNDRRNG